MVTTPKVPRCKPLSAHNVARLQVETSCTATTIRKFQRGESIREATLRRLTKACGKLAIELGV
jgi:hypothetical protein